MKAKKRQCVVCKADISGRKHPAKMCEGCALDKRAERSKEYGRRKSSNPKWRKQKNLNAHMRYINVRQTELHCCEVCDVDISHLRRSVKCCSHECKIEKQRLRYHRNNPTEKRRCVICSTVFVGNTNAVTCSSECTMVRRRNNYTSWRRENIEAHREYARINAREYRRRDPERYKKYARRSYAKQRAKINLIREIETKGLGALFT